MSDTEYITKDDAIQAIFSFPYVMRNSEILHKIANSIRFTPSKEVAPVVHAHWIRLGGGLAKCNACKWIVKDCYDQNNEDLFCRKCGAKMDESEEK